MPALALSARGLRPFFLSWRFRVSSMSLVSSASSNVGASAAVASASASSVMGNGAYGRVGETGSAAVREASVVVSHLLER